MIEKYLNQEAEICIAFANWGGGGSVPRNVVGKITNMDNEFVEITFDPKAKQNAPYFKNTSGKMLVKKEYIISVVLL